MGAPTRALQYFFVFQWERCKTIKIFHPSSNNEPPLYETHHMPIPLLNPAILARLEALGGGLRATNLLKIQKPRNNV